MDRSVIPHGVISGIRAFDLPRLLPAAFCGLFLT